ncbi:HTH-type transcriptional regulator MalT [Pasteurella skyensis]|uniref:HTH-type transcriptional regulator MalT n=1 Tax=Phocoenobacter skyensis TaxID=97481 RepID=UPI0027589671|nr:HTH-type transcriptional regulator MalT [Pasteurella skyensis]MDP8176895.1 HTH-type transcriptional regulator MalT [Pasteurella skyensis]MDP8199494.1 HTH-type transcriptional regulator MalT [Pasteurella skyensis]
MQSLAKLIPTKLISSKQNKTQSNHNIERTLLLAELDKVHSYPLTLIIAPAGYGKTTLISQWKDRQSHTGWYALDKSDNKAEQFSRYFTAALVQACGMDTENLTYQNDLIDYFSQLLVKLNHIEVNFSLIIDDYHHIENSEIHDALRFWLKNQPSTMNLIILSRLTPPLSITNLRIHEQLLEINMNQLAFTHKEAGQFFELKLKGSFSQDAIFTLCEQVEGWATGLQLISFILKQNTNLIKTPQKLFAKLNQHHIADYLNEEIFHYIDPELKQFMQRCAILHSMNEGLAIAITQDKNSAKKLDELEKQGLFIQRIDSNDGDIWWKFHPILSSYLTQSCRLELPDEWQKLNQCAAIEWLKLGFCQEAIYHAQQVTDTQVLYKILQQHGWSLFHQGQLKLLEDSLNHLPAELMWQDPTLVLLKAWVVQSQHRYQEVSGILQKFNTNSPLAEHYQGKFDALRGQVALNEGDDELAYKLASNALLTIPQEFSYARIVAISVIAEAQHCHGNLKDAMAQMKQVEKMALSQHTYHHWLWSKLQQAEILSAQGFLQSAYDVLKETTSQAETFHQIPMHEFLLRLKGQIQWEWHNLEQAETMANAGIDILEKEDEKLQCLALLAKISLVRGDLNNAKRLIEQCQHSIKHLPVHKDWTSTLDEIQVLYAQMTDDHSQLDSWLVKTTLPSRASNHFTQRQSRNIARAYLLQNKPEQALNILNTILHTAEHLKLTSDIQRALILRNLVFVHQNKKELAQKDLIRALEMSQQTNFISAFVIEGDVMAQQIRQLLQMNILDEFSTPKTQFILRSINQHNRHKFAHFDQQFVQKLLENPQVPELLKISPLTAREWQVLGLIYSGYSNEQISQELVVAITTIKTHIRNLYQKIGVTNRSEAIEYTKNLLVLMGYH